MTSKLCEILNRIISKHKYAASGQVYTYTDKKRKLSAEEKEERKREIKNSSKSQNKEDTEDQTFL